MGYKVKLEIFEGPLDLLLYLIKEEELDIYDIPITRITEQYLEYLNLMQMLDLDVAGEFLVMAATLMQIKSRMLLPPDPVAETAEEADPRAELIRRLLEYKAYKEAAEKFKALEEERSRIFPRFGVEPEFDGADIPLAELSIFDLLAAFQKILKSTPDLSDYQIGKDEYSVADKVKEITERLKKGAAVRFSSLFKSARNKMEVITTFLALLELIKQRKASASQESHFTEIEIRPIEGEPALPSEGEAR